MIIKPIGRLAAAADAAASGKSEEDARIELARRERAGWLPAQHASGYFAILSRRGIEVARFEREVDRDAVLALARLEAAAGPAITALAFAQETYRGADDPLGFAQTTLAKNGLVAALDRLDGRK